MRLLHLALDSFFYARNPYWKLDLQYSFHQTWLARWRTRLLFSSRQRNQQSLRT